MRMTLRKCLGTGIFSATLLVSTNASAIPLATVGQVDEFIQSAPWNSGAGNEQTWVALALGVNSADYTQLQGSGSSVWQPVTGGPAGTNLYAIDFGAFGFLPAYFLVKTGNLAATNDDHFLYRNLSEARYGIIDLNDFGDDLTIEVGKISHAGVAGGTTLQAPTPAPMPEPTTLLLLGSGLALVARQVRRRWTAVR